MLMQSALGVVAILAMAWLVSENRRAVAWRLVAVDSRSPSHLQS